MDKEIKDVKEDSQIEVEKNEQVNEEPKGENKEFINSLVDEKLETIKKFYTNELDKQKKEIVGINRKNSELQNEIKKYKAKEMTVEEQLELKEKEINEEWARIYRLKAINKFALSSEEDDDIDFTDYLNGDNEEEILNKAEKLKLWIDKKINTGIAKGVEQRIATGYVPKAGVQSQGKKDYTDIDKKELGELYLQAHKAGNQDEMKLIEAEQMRRLKLAV